MDHSSTDKKQTLSGVIRERTAGMMSSIGTVLHKLGFHPDAITIAGWVLVIVGSYFIGQGAFLTGAIWYMLALPFDALDGAVARAMQREGQFGAMLDSTLDRYADGFIFAAFSYYFAVQGQFDLFIVAQVALIGSFAVSYARARAEGLGVDCKVGWFTRMERLAVILLISLFPILLTYGIWLLAFGTNVTAMQRMWYVYRTLKIRGE